MFLAQRLVFLGEERLPFQAGGANLRRETNICTDVVFTQYRYDLPVCLWLKGVFWTYRAHKTGVMPGESQRLQKLVSGLDGEVAAMAVGTKHGVVV